MNWWLIVIVFGFVENLHAQLYEDGVGSNDCPKKCSCLGDFLDCTNIKLRTVPFIPKWIRSVELSHNELGDDVQNYIANARTVTDLKLNKNRIHKFPVFVGLDHLITLQLASNKIEVISAAAISALPLLTTLDLSKNKIRTVVQGSFPPNNNLLVVNLNYNIIKGLDIQSFANLREILELKLNHNLLGAIPAKLFQNLKKIRRLELNGNSFSEIPWNTFRNLSRLRVLKLRNNNIKDLQTGAFHGLQNLLILELDNNNLTEIHKSGFFNLTTLNSISLSNNSISKIEQNTWEFCQRLISIDLSNNKLTTINAYTFECLSKLKELNLSNNGISMISEGAFNCTSNLDFLDLSKNQISWTIEDMNAPFQVLRKLDRLYLSENKIKSINKNAFIGLISLTHLDLAYNNITSMQSDAFLKLPKLTELVLNTTTLICDCNLLWFYEWLSTGYYANVNVTCNYPLALRGKLLQSLTKDNLTCSETPNPRIIEEPHSMLAIKEKNLTLSCSATSSSSLPMSFKWRRDNFELKDVQIDIETLKQPLTNHTVSTSRLILYNVSHTHAGRYQCVVSNNYGTTYSQKIKINVVSFPKFMKIPTNVTLNSTSTARLDCAATGDPHPQIAWQKDGGNDFPAARERRMHVMPTDDAFFIINAKITDQGVYTCTAENPAGIIKANATLIVHEPPSFVKPMENKEVTTGKSSVLECMASGSPKPSLEWLKDDKPIEVTERHFFAADDQLLIIVDTIASDAGTYTCTMSNWLGEEKGFMHLKVNPAVSSAVINADEMTGIVIITVVCCAVGTSIIWVVIIYQTRKGRGCTSHLTGRRHENDIHPYSGAGTENNKSLGNDLPKIITITETETLLSNDKFNQKTIIVPIVPKGTIENYSLNSDYNLDDLSSKDSGTGDSAKRSNNDESLNNYNVENYTSEISCIDIDKTSPTISYKTTPVTTPSHEGPTQFIDDEEDGSNSDYKNLQISSLLHQKDSARIHIQTNKLNALIHKNEHSNGSDQLNHD